MNIRSGQHNVENAIISPLEAEYILKNENYEKQRKIRPAQVEYLKEEMLEERFVDGTTINFCILNGKRHLVNGQHTLSAIISSGMAQRLSIVNHYVQTEDQMAEIYYRLDTNLKRTAFDALHAKKNTKNTSVEYINKAFSACNIICRNFVHVNKKISPDVILSMMEYYRNAIDEYYKNVLCCAGMMRDKFLRASTFSIAIVTLHYQAEKARSFWQQVLHDDKLAVGDPRKTLRDFLLISARHGGRRGYSNHGVRLYSERELITSISNAWNAYYAGTQLRRIVNRGNSDINISGTPFVTKKS